MENKHIELLAKKPDPGGWNYIHNEIIERISGVYVPCPECENMDDEQYGCGTCNGQGSSGHVNILDWVKAEALSALQALETALTEKHRAEVEERDAIINKLSHVIQLMNEKPKTYCECSQQTPDTLGFGCSYCLNCNELIIH